MHNQTDFATGARGHCHLQTRYPLLPPRKELDKCVRVETDGDYCTLGELLKIILGGDPEILVNANSTLEIR